MPYHPMKTPGIESEMLLASDVCKAYAYPILNPQVADSPAYTRPSDPSFVYNGPALLVANHSEKRDAFAIHTAFYETAPGDYKRHAFVQPIMRDDFFGPASPLVNPLFERLGIVFVHREGSKKAGSAREEADRIKNAALDGGKLLLYPGKTRSKDGSLFYAAQTSQNGEMVRDFADPAKFARMLGIENLAIIPTAYSRDPTTDAVYVRFVEPLRYSSWNKASGKTKTAYYDDLSDQILNAVAENVMVHTAHVGSILLKYSFENFTFLPIGLNYYEDRFNALVEKVEEAMIPCSPLSDLSPSKFLDWASDHGFLRVSKGKIVFRKKHVRSHAHWGGSCDGIPFYANQASSIPKLEELAKTV